MSDVEFFEPLRSVLISKIPDCTNLLKLERLSGGASMETYRITIDSEVGERYLCLRRGSGGVNRDTPSAVGLDTEAFLMKVARAQGVSEPEVFYVLTADDGIGVGFIMEWLDGETLGARIARAPELGVIRGNLAFQCGRELAKIHAIDTEATGLNSVLKTLSPVQYVNETWDRYRAWNTPQPMIDYTAQWLLVNAPTVNRLCLVHNDFRNGNIMVDETKGLTAVLDWETAHIGDPMRDLGWICTNSWRFGNRHLPVGGFGEYQDLFDGYESQSGHKVDPNHVKYWEVFGSFWWAVGCLGMADHYRTGPDATVERPAIARRSSECQVDCVNLLLEGPIDDVPTTNHEVQYEMPTIEELLGSVRDFLHGDVMNETSGRTSFLARVAGNSLEIVLRDLRQGSKIRLHERDLLVELLDAAETDELGDLRWQLVQKIRMAGIDLNDVALCRYLRQSVVNQVSIDQPKYSGYKWAIGSRDHS